MAAKKSGKPKASAQSAARASKQPAPKNISKGQTCSKKERCLDGAKKPVTTKTRSNKQASVKKQKQPLLKRLQKRTGKKVAAKKSSR